MSAIWPDLTGKLEAVHRRAFRIVADAAEAAGVEWFLTGALARDWVFTLMHGIDTLRATRDADIAIALSGWDEFECIRLGIIESGKFTADRALHRLNHRHLPGFHIDLVPFGPIGGQSAEIKWPPAQDVVMNVIGFAEAFHAAITVLADTGLPVRVASPAGLMLMKVFAWEDRKHHAGNKDASDIRLLLARYGNLLGDNALYAAEGLMAAEDYFLDRAAARLLGRHVAGIIAPATRAALCSILDRELQKEWGGQLVQQLAVSATGRRMSVSDDFEQTFALLKSFRAGLDD